MSLFKSCHQEYGDADQKRDFVYIKDALAMTQFFLDNTYIGGLFNIGTGKAQSWNECANALFSAIEKKQILNIFICLNS